MKKYTHKEFVAKFKNVNKNDIEILGTYHNSVTKILVKCQDCNHKWKTIPRVLLRGHGCPECGKKIAASVNKYPNYEKKFLKKIKNIYDDKIEIISKYKSYQEHIDVKCNICDYRWTTIPNRLYKNGCWMCGHKSKGLKHRKSKEQFLKELCEAHYGQIIALESYVSGKEHIKVKCLTCKHIWSPRASNLVRKHARGCPNCVISKGEQKIKHIFKQNNINFVREFTFKNLISEAGGTLRFDFAIIGDDKLSHLIEYDGLQHFEPVEYMGGIDRYKRQIKIDKLKNDYCENNEIYLIRIKYDQYDNINIKMLFGDRYEQYCKTSYCCEDKIPK